MTICRTGVRSRTDHYGRHMAIGMAPPRPPGPSVLRRKSVVASTFTQSQWQQNNATTERDSATANQRCFIADATVPYSLSVPGLITRDDNNDPPQRLSTLDNGPMSQARVISTEVQREQFNRKVDTDTISRRKRTATQMMAPNRPDEMYQTNHNVRTMALDHLTKPAVRIQTGIPPQSTISETMPLGCAIRSGEPVSIAPLTEGCAIQSCVGNGATLTRRPWATERHTETIPTHMCDVTTNTSNSVPIVHPTINTTHIQPHNGIPVRAATSHNTSIHIPRISNIKLNTNIGTISAAEPLSCHSTSILSSGGHKSHNTQSVVTPNNAVKLDRLGATDVVSHGLQHANSFATITPTGFHNPIYNAMYGLVPVVTTQPRTSYNTCGDNYEGVSRETRQPMHSVKTKSYLTNAPVERSVPFDERPSRETHTHCPHINSVSANIEPHGSTRFLVPRQPDGNVSGFRTHANISDVNTVNPTMQLSVADHHYQCLTGVCTSESPTNTSHPNISTGISIPTVTDRQGKEFKIPQSTPSGSVATLLDNIPTMSPVHVQPQHRNTPNQSASEYHVYTIPTISNPSKTNHQQQGMGLSTHTTTFGTLDQRHNVRNGVRNNNHPSEIAMDLNNVNTRDVSTLRKCSHGLSELHSNNPTTSTGVAAIGLASHPLASNVNTQQLNTNNRVASTSVIMPIHATTQHHNDHSTSCVQQNHSGVTITDTSASVTANGLASRLFASNVNAKQLNTNNGVANTSVIMPIHAAQHHHDHSTSRVQQNHMGVIVADNALTLGDCGLHPIISTKLWNKLTSAIMAGNQNGTIIPRMDDKVNWIPQMLQSSIAADGNQSTGTLARQSDHEPNGKITHRSAGPIHAEQTTNPTTLTRLGGNSQSFSSNNLGAGMTATENTIGRDQRHTKALTKPSNTYDGITVINRDDNWKHYEDTRPGHLAQHIGVDRIATPHSTVSQNITATTQAPRSDQDIDTDIRAMARGNSTTRKQRSSWDRSAPLKNYKDGLTNWLQHGKVFPG
jgi:hypothetical protein